MDYGIGYKNDLLVKIPDDLRRFKSYTKHNTVVMGRKTFESIGSKALPDRRNIVLTRNKEEVPPQEVDYFYDVRDVIVEHDEFSHDDFYIIGGAEIYKQFLPYCNEIMLTIVHASYPHKDTYFPIAPEGVDDLSELLHHFKVEHSHYNFEMNGYPSYSYVTLVRKVE